MIALTGGGTGGHLAVVKAIKDSLDSKPIFIGSSGGQDMAWFADDDGFKERYFLDSFGVMNRRGIYKLFSIINIFLLTIKTIKIFKKHRIKTVLSVGGYSAAPAVFAAIVTRKKLYIHEQNATMGTLNKIAKPFAKELFSSFAQRSICKDYPVAKEFFASKRIRSRVKTVIFLGGSQGARAINDFALDLALTLKEKNINIIHQTGKSDLQRVKEFYRSHEISATVFDFDKNILPHITKADLAICRSGAGTLFELTANGLPAVFVPYPFAAGNHQLANANFLANKNLGWVNKESDLMASKVAKLLETNLDEISSGLIDLIKPNGAKCIAKTIAL